MKEPQPKDRESATSMICSEPHDEGPPSEKRCAGSNAGSVGKLLQLSRIPMQKIGLHENSARWSRGSSRFTNHQNRLANVDDHGDNHTVDDMIEVSEMEEERHLQHILEGRPATTESSNSPPLDSTTIRRNLDISSESIYNHDLEITPDNDRFSSIRIDISEMESASLQKPLHQTDLNEHKAHDENSQYERFQQLLDGMEPQHWNAISGKPDTDPVICTSLKERKLPNEQQIFPSNSFDGTPSPSSSVAKPIVPGTPSTGFSSFRPLGLATPPSSCLGDENPTHESIDLDNKIDNNALGFWRRTWKKKACRWLALGVGILVVTFMGLIIAASKLDDESQPLSQDGSPIGESNGSSSSSLGSANDFINQDVVLNFTMVDDVEETLSPSSMDTPEHSYPESIPPDEKEKSTSSLLVSTPENMFANLQESPGSFYIEDQLKKVLEVELPETIEYWVDPNSPQSKARNWVLVHSPTRLEIEKNPLRLQQKYALAVFYYAMEGDHWNNNHGWLTLPNECDWYVSAKHPYGRPVCDDMGNYIEIDLRSNNLQGSFPSEVLLLKENLKQIRVNGNAIEGTIPEEWRALSNLKRLHLHYNNLSGKIPSDLNGLSALQSLRLGKNDFIGTLPWQLSELTNLEYLDVSSNELIGGIPFLFGDLTALTDLNLSQNKLSGEIPEEIGSLRSLIHLKLDRNNLTGNMPREVCLSFSLMESASVDCDEVYCWCCDKCSDGNDDW